MRALLALVSLITLVGCEREADPPSARPSEKRSAATEEPGAASAAPVTGAPEIRPPARKASPSERAAYAASEEGRLGPVLRFSRLLGGRGRFCGLGSDGALRCFGSAPLERRGPFVDLALAEGALCVLPLSGPLDCGAATPRELGVAPVRLASGGAHFCALDARGTVACFGLDGAPALPPPPGLRGSALGVGRGFACVADPTDKLVCWGDVEPLWLPTTPEDARELAVGERFVCRLDEARGEPTCWGQGPRLPSARYRTLSAAHGTLCGVTEDGRGRCRGAVELDLPRAERLSVGADAVCVTSDSGRSLSCHGPAAATLTPPRAPSLELR